MEKNERGDRKWESYDSPEIQDRRQISDIPGFQSGCVWGGGGGVGEGGGGRGG